MRAIVDDTGRLVLPPETAARLGLKPGVTVHFDEVGDSLRLQLPVTRLAKVYVEATNRCNLACRTCIRNVWDTPMGLMADTTFSRIIEGLRAVPTPFTVFFGGYGEPMSHPAIVDMVAQAKALKASVELITNGTLLTAQRSHDLIAAGLDVLWVSLDGAKPESYADVRLGATLTDVLGNIEYFRDLRQPTHRPKPEIGLVFVAMQRNIHDLPELLRLGRKLGVSRCLVSNVLPHTEPMRAQVLYTHALNHGAFLPSSRLSDLRLPRMDADVLANEALYEAICGNWNLSFAGDYSAPAGDHCPFIKSGAVTIGWDGSVSPCLPLLYTNGGFLNGIERFSKRHIVGNVNERGVLDLWNTPEYAAFRERVQDFDFAPCTYCVGCELSETNDEDCYANTFPTCGGCLWAQGIIRCP